MVKKPAEEDPERFVGVLLDLGRTGKAESQGARVRPVPVGGPAPGAFSSIRVGGLIPRRRDPLQRVRGMRTRLSSLTL